MLVKVIYACSYNVEILSSFNTELKIKNTEPAIKNNLKCLNFKLRV